ncbi:MAG TPA: alkaline phosphatase family protein [Solirubrobacteraceae bacterium]|nr:alkaline phosphatase family protein [Solirubrobacteraceae bacterium]
MSGITTARMLDALKGFIADLSWRPGKRIPADAASPANLSRIEHVVVLMMENRSFDHMLGYLGLPGGLPGLDGVQSARANAYDGQDFHVKHLVGPDGLSQIDPYHGGSDVDQQLAGENGGFVANYAKKHPPDPGVIMGYFDGGDLPAYDHLARQYCVCDKWFSSTPGATWPNRLYAITGRCANTREDLSPPLYFLPSAMRYLNDGDWRWYSNDPGSLRLVDQRFRLGHRDNFAYFDRRAVDAIVELGEDLIVNPKAGFLDDAANGNLPKVSWIDPNYNDLSILGQPSNDDHPPSDVRAGQALVWSVYRALAGGPQSAWEKTLLIVTYDEHGGFYDHVVPPEDAAGDTPEFRRYGVRVPALVVSPWIEPGTVCHTIFDHTSILKTILLRFCRDGKGTIPDMGPRVSGANDLSALLAASAARAVPEGQAVTDQIVKWHLDNITEHVHLPLPARDIERIEGFAAGIVAASRRLRDWGLPAGRP